MKKVSLIVCVAMLVATLGAVVGCGGSSGEPSTSPSQVADKYLQATLNLDVNTAYELLSSEDKNTITKEQMEEIASTTPEDFDYTYELGEETIDGDTATVTVKIFVDDPTSGQSEEFEDILTLVKEDGAWKIYFGDGL